MNPAPFGGFEAGTEGEVIPDVEDDPEEDDEEDGIQETFFEFEEFEMVRSRRYNGSYFC